eukprot:m.129599 g.129599  ORF g.129599 m.129599 type:complete len:740 (+) comp29409_c5_seq1:236-2455(+)
MYPAFSLADKEVLPPGPLKKPSVTRRRFKRDTPAPVVELIRKQRNKEAAQDLRSRKKKYESELRLKTTGLESDVHRLERQESDLNIRLQNLRKLLAFVVPSAVHDETVFEQQDQEQHESEGFDGFINVSSDAQFEANDQTIGHGSMMHLGPALPPSSLLQFGDDAEQQASLSSSFQIEGSQQQPFPTVEHQRQSQSQSQFEFEFESSESSQLQPQHRGVNESVSFDIDTDTDVDMGVVGSSTSSTSQSQQQVQRELQQEIQEEIQQEMRDQEQSSSPSPSRSRFQEGSDDNDTQSNDSGLEDVQDIGSDCESDSSSEVSSISSPGSQVSAMDLFGDNSQSPLQSFDSESQSQSQCGDQDQDQSHDQDKFQSVRFSQLERHREQQALQQSSRSDQIRSSKHEQPQLQAQSRVQPQRRSVDRIIKINDQIVADKHTLTALRNGTLPLHTLLQKMASATQQQNIQSILQGQSKHTLSSSSSSSNRADDHLVKETQTKTQNETQNQNETKPKSERKYTPPAPAPAPAQHVYRKRKQTKQHDENTMEVDNTAMLRIKTESIETAEFYHHSQQTNSKRNTALATKWTTTDSVVRKIVQQTFQVSQNLVLLLTAWLGVLLLVLLPDDEENDNAQHQQHNYHEQHNNHQQHLRCCSPTLTSSTTKTKLKPTPTPPSIQLSLPSKSSIANLNSISGAISKTPTQRHQRKSRRIRGISPATTSTLSTSSSNSDWSRRLTIPMTTSLIFV